MEEANECIKRDAALKTNRVLGERAYILIYMCVSLCVYRVSEESGVDGVKDGDKLDLFDIDVRYKP